MTGLLTEITIIIRMASGKEHVIRTFAGLPALGVMRRIRDAGKRCWLDTEDGPVLLNVRNVESIVITDGHRRLKEDQL